MTGWKICHLKIGNTSTNESMVNFPASHVSELGGVAPQEAGSSSSPIIFKGEMLNFGGVGWGVPPTQACIGGLQHQQKDLHASHCYYERGIILMCVWIVQKNTNLNLGDILMHSPIWKRCQRHRMQVSCMSFPQPQPKIEKKTTTLLALFLWLATRPPEKANHFTWATKKSLLLSIILVG